MYFLFFKPHRWSKRSAAQPQAICSEVPQVVAVFYTKSGEMSSITLFALNFSHTLCYCIRGATSNGRRFPLPGGIFLPPIERKGVVDLVTWQELFQFGIFLIALISLIIQDKENKK